MFINMLKKIRGGTLQVMNLIKGIVSRDWKGLQIVSWDRLFIFNLNVFTINRTFKEWCLSVCALVQDPLSGFSGVNDTSEIRQKKILWLKSL
jgi:hypothetical protein